MALSDQLSKLAARAKEAEDRTAAAQKKAKADLEQDVKAARESAQAQADRLRKNAETDKAMLSDWWDDMQRSWNDHLATVRDNIDQRRAQHDLKTAQREADSAEEDASFAIDYAYGAVEEAEYAVLDATLARMDAEELAATAPKS
jgi:aspartate oxidase